MAPDKPEVPAVEMEMWMWYAIGAAAVLVVLLAAWFIMSRRSKKARSERLREQYGTEYDYTVSEMGRSKGEANLEERQRTASTVTVRPLSVDEAREFTRSWEQIQVHFVDYPAEAVLQADRLVAEVMQTRGYPALGFDDRAALVSVDHPRATTEYREAREIAMKSQRNGVSTEELRQAMVHYRAVFTELTEVAPEVMTENRSDGTRNDVPGAPVRAGF